MGTLTLTTTAAQDLRIAAAFGERLGLGRDATGQEVRADVIAFLKTVVLQHEQNVAAESARAAVTDIGDVT